MSHNTVLLFTIADAIYRRKIERHTSLVFSYGQGKVSFQWIQGCLLVYPQKGMLCIGKHHILYGHRVHCGDRLSLNGVSIDINIISHEQINRPKARIQDELAMLFTSLFTTVGHMLV